MPTKTLYTQSPAGAERDKTARAVRRWLDTEQAKEAARVDKLGARLYSKARKFGPVSYVELLLALDQFLQPHLDAAEGQNGAELSPEEGQEEGDE